MTYEPREEVCAHCGEAKESHVGGMYTELVCPKDIVPVHIERIVWVPEFHQFGAQGTVNLQGEFDCVNIHIQEGDPPLLPGRKYRLIITDEPRAYSITVPGLDDGPDEVVDITEDPNAVLRHIEESHKGVQRLDKPDDPFTVTGSRMIAVNDLLAFLDDLREQIDVCDDDYYVWAKCVDKVHQWVQHPTPPTRHDVAPGRAIE